METLEQKKRRLFGKKYLQDYLAELESLTIGHFRSDSILTIEDTDVIIKKFKGRRVYIEKMSFNDKSRLTILFKCIQATTNFGFYIFTSYSIYCGAASISNLKEFNINFNFRDEHAGIISLISQDLRVKLILDFYEDNQYEYLDFEVFGDVVDINDFLSCIS